MKAAKDIERKIKQKQEENQRLKIEIERNEAYVEGLKDSLRLFQRTAASNGTGAIRPNSQVDKARAVLRAERKPMHVSEILRKSGREPSKKNKLSLSGSLGWYVRHEEVFTRPAPNTFGLLEFTQKQYDEAAGVPDGFGVE